MESKDFDLVVKDVCTKIESVLCSKAKEYASKDNRLHNFIEAAKLLDCSDVFALAGMMNKHIVSVYDIVKNYERENILPSEQILEEKIGDSINYLILLKAMILEKISCKENEKTMDSVDKVVDNKKDFYMYEKEFEKLNSCLNYFFFMIKEYYQAELMRNVAELKSGKILFLTWVHNVISIIEKACPMQKESSMTQQDKQVFEVHRQAILSKFKKFLGE